MLTRIEEFGWRGAAEPGIGRVVSAHGDYYHLVANDAPGEILARKKKGAFLSAATRPITGDFVRFRYNASGESMITEVLPRRSHFERMDPTARRKAQTLAVNFDVLFLMMSLNENFSLPRLARYLALAEDIGEARAVVVLTKIDLGNGFAPPDTGGVETLVISSVTGEGVDDVRRYAAPRSTLAFIGSSGVGKSTLLNVLAGEEVAATQEIQQWSGKGRHTTTSRELVMLPSGAMVIDTPGIREIGIVGESVVERAKGESTHRWRK